MLLILSGLFAMSPHYALAKVFIPGTSCGITNLIRTIDDVPDDFKGDTTGMDCTLLRNGRNWHRYYSSIPVAGDQVLAVGGFVYLEVKSNTVTMGQAELVDMANPEIECKRPPDLPYGVSDGQMAYFEGKALFCSTGCHSLGPGAQEWTGVVDSQTFHRVSAASSMIGGVWLISGGYSYITGAKESSTEYWDGAQFQDGPTLPGVMQHHCQVTIGGSEVFFSRITYIDAANPLGLTFMLDWDTKTWSSLAGMDSARNKDLGGCGTYLTPEGKLEIVSVGRGISDIYSVEDNQWRQGPDFTPYTVYLSTVQVGGTFWALGGKYDSSLKSMSDAFMKYESEQDGFKALPQKLEIARCRFSALVVPGDFCQLET